MSPALKPLAKPFPFVDMAARYIAVADSRRYAQRIADIAAQEAESPRWSREARIDLKCIRMAALGVLDGLDGAADELDVLLTDWAEGAHYATFPAVDAVVRGRAA